MIDYKVTINKEERYFKIEGDIVPGSKPVEIPVNSIGQQKIIDQFISIFLNKRDIEKAIDYTHLMSADNPLLANEALFIAALSTYFKCFQNSGSRIALDENAFIRFSPQHAKEFEKYKLWRNKHFIHDENSMDQAFAFIPVSPKCHNEKLGGLPSVIWSSAPIDFVEESKSLHDMMQETWRYAVKKADELGDRIIKSLENISHDELLLLPDIKGKLASLDAPESKRE